MTDIDARQLVDDLIDRAIAARASDIHVDPITDGCQIKFRIDGLLQSIESRPSDVGRMIVTRLMVMAKLLTYRPGVPQEGRAVVASNSATNGAAIELRISIMPTTHGPRAAVRLPAELLQPQSLDDLMLPTEVLDGLKKFASADAGMLLVIGPAGAGKTTTIYALLRHIAQSSAGMSIVSQEDPVERDLSAAGIVQIEVSPFGELSYERALRSILRQDPQVLMLGEIRDAATASIAVQAALSGHRLICTLHASTPAGAIVRLLEMGVEPYQLTSAVFGITSQRLLRKREGETYRGRIPIAQFVEMDEALRRAILSRADIDTLQAGYSSQTSYRSLECVAAELVQQGRTDADEVKRIVGDTGVPPVPTTPHGRDARVTEKPS
jgi:type II secretory ATPase GspE/PulE/Tfp pilus assembly ATPase PilB-like protein